MSVTSAFIGTGPDPEVQDNERYAMAYRHAAAYEEADTELAACADIIRENAEAFAATGRSTTRTSSKSTRR
jgi:hypothetical protein